MKKIIAMLAVLSITAFANTQTIELTGAYSEQLGNPFKKILKEEKSGTVNIYSENKAVELKVESDLNDRDFYSSTKPHPDTIIINNKDVENIVEDYYLEKYSVNKGNYGNPVIANIQSGKVKLNYNFDDEDRNHVQILIGVEVELKVEITKNGIPITQTITMDQTLGREGDNFDWSIGSENFKGKKPLNELVQEIIENEIYKIIKN